MNYLHILSEDDNDDAFYKRCVEKLTGEAFFLISRRLRRGGGISQVRRYMNILFDDIRHTGPVENTFFVVALDNDRSPVHPEHEKLPGVHKLPKKEQRKVCRFCEIEREARQALGENREEWPIKGAIAVPVQMMESWLLLICNGEEYDTEANLPVFAKKDSGLARLYYAPRKPTDQLKDLRNIERRRLSIASSWELCVDCGNHLIPEELRERSDSFVQFEDQVKEWFGSGDQVRT
ncbi:MAG: hypothetical protein GY856_26105 [bacterium]|nr:hypothetical protein [bacterium]